MNKFNILSAEKRQKKIIEKKLEIYINSAEIKDTQVFFGEDRIKSMQKVSLSCSTDSITTLGLNVTSILFEKEEKPKINKDTIRIIVDNFSDSCSSQNVHVFIGEEQMGLIKKLEFSANVSFPYNDLVIYPSVISETFEKFPKWVSIEYGKDVVKVG